MIEDSRPGDTNRHRFNISGMSCGHCVSAVRSALGDVAGVTVDDVSLGSATIRYGTSRNFPEIRREINRVLAEEGYVLADVGAEPQRP